MDDAAGPVVVVPAPPRAQGPTDLETRPRGPSMITETLNDMVVEPIAALVAGTARGGTARGAPHQQSAKVVEDEYDKFGKGKDPWDPAHLMSELLFTATATDEQKAKRQAEKEFRERMKVDLTRQNRDMKTVLQLKKLMYLDPVPRADLYNLTATKGLVSHRIRKKVWPKLLGLNPYSLTAAGFRSAAGLGHSDASIVYEDVKRSSWIRLYVDAVGEAAKGLVEQQQQGSLQRLINGVVCSNLDTVHYVQGLHEVAAVCLMTLGEDTAYHVLELILLHHLHDSSGSKDGVDLIVSHLRIFMLLLRQTDPEMLNILRVILEDAEMHDESTEMEFKIMFLPWVLTWFSAVIIPEPTAEILEAADKSPTSREHLLFSGADDDDSEGDGWSAGAATGSEPKRPERGASFQDRLAVVARLFDLFLVSDALMPVYVGCTLLSHFKEAIIKRKNSVKGLANPSAVGRWVVHALPAMLNAHVLPQVIDKAIALHRAVPPHQLMSHGLKLPVTSSFYTFPYIWMHQPLRVDRILRRVSASTERYEGKTNSKGQLHGWGRYTYPNGNMYEGKYEKGLRNGLGRFVWRRTDEKYEGEWRGDQRNGFGTHIWHDGTKYMGEFRTNELEGAGVYMWPDGRRYEGKFRNNKQHGVGVFVDVDGTVTAAEWIEGAISRTIPISHIGACQEEAAHASHLARSKKDLLLQMLKANAVVIEVGLEQQQMGRAGKLLQWIGLKKKRDAVEEGMKAVR